MSCNAIDVSRVRQYEEYSILGFGIVPPFSQSDIANLKQNISKEGKGKKKERKGMKEMKEENKRKETREEKRREEKRKDKRKEEKKRKKKKGIYERKEDYKFAIYKYIVRK